MAAVNGEWGYRAMTFRRLAVLDSRIVYAAVFLSILLPLWRPLGLSISVSQGTFDVYEVVDSLSQDDTVIVSPSFAPSSEAEVYPQMEAILRHLLARKARVAFVNLNVEGRMYAEKAMTTLAPEFGYNYGEDYVILPFTPGLETAVASISDDFLGTYERDAYGTPLTETGALAGIRSINDFALVVDFNTGDTTIYYIQHAKPRGIPVIAGASGVTVPYLTPYLATGQLSGLIGGLRGAAEYETAIDNPGMALAAMDAQSLSHASILALIGLGNAAYFLAKRDDARTTRRSRQSNGGELK
jgi:hypothetical protein